VGAKCRPSQASRGRLGGPVATGPYQGRIRVPSAAAERAYFGRLPGDLISAGLIPVPSADWPAYVT